MSHDKRAGGLAALEDFDGYEFVFENGYYARVAFKRDEAKGPAHSYKYSLTLHAPEGKRLVGFDNAHLVRRLSGGSGGEATARTTGTGTRATRDGHMNSSRLNFSSKTSSTKWNGCCASWVSTRHQ